LTLTFEPNSFSARSVNGCEGEKQIDRQNEASARLQRAVDSLHDRADLVGPEVLDHADRERKIVRLGLEIGVLDRRVAQLDAGAKEPIELLMLSASHGHPLPSASMPGSTLTTEHPARASTN
jgi:hypothetical protein